MAAEKQVSNPDIYERMAELWIKQDSEGITDKEGEELDNLLRMNAEKYLHRARLTNLREVAEQTGDEDWTKLIDAEWGYRKL